MEEIIKRKYFIIILCLIVFIPVIAFLISGQPEEQNINYNEQIKESSKIEISQPIEEYQYVLKEFNGKLAVFEKGDKDPQMIFDVSIDSLPEIDMIELKQGLKIKDANELNERIEDFIS